MRVLRRAILIGFAMCGVTRINAQEERRYLDAARGAAKWIRSTQRITIAGTTWPADPLKPTERTTSLYSGSAGVVLFLLELHAASGEAVYLADARAGADELLARIPKDLSHDGAGLYTGVAGTGFVLLETYRATQDGKYRAGVEQIVRLLEEHARPAGGGIEWGPVTDIISGSAGTGLFLLRAAKEQDLPRARTLATAAGKRLLQLSEDKDAGKDWAMSPTYARRMPNFSHGTAGVAFFLATLYRETREREFLDAAIAGARYLQSIADTSYSGCTIYHHEPDGRDLFYLGWCHGPAGTARLFYQLTQATGDPEWMRWVGRSAQSLVSSGIPEKRTPGFWNNAGQCCGNAGVAQFFVDLHRATGRREYLGFAKRVAADTLKRATEIDPIASSANPGKQSNGARGLKWIQAEHRVRPELLIAQTGYMQGAAGIGMLLLHLDGLEQDRPPAIVFPDSPFR